MNLLSNQRRGELLSVFANAIGGGGGGGGEHTPKCHPVNLSNTGRGSRLTFVALHEVTWCMVVLCTQEAPRRQQFHVAPAVSAL